MTSAASIVAAIPAVRAGAARLAAEFCGATNRRRQPARSWSAATSAPSSARAADVKLYITADAEIARRAAGQRVARTRRGAIYENVLQDLSERDARDRGRRDAPLSAAADAEIIDTTALDAEAVVERAAELVARALAERAFKEKEWL